MTTFNIIKDSLDEYQFPTDINENAPSSDTSQFHITYLKNQFRDIARPNMFKVKIQPPNNISAEWDILAPKLVLLKKANIPALKVGKTELERAGLKIHIPNNSMDFGEASLTFYNDVDYDLRSLFTRWQKLVLFNWEQNIGANIKKALDGAITVYQYDSTFNPMYGVRLINCWPESISEIQFDQDAENQVEEFTVTFAYTYQETFK